MGGDGEMDVFGTKRNFVERGEIDFFSSEEASKLQVTLDLLRTQRNEDSEASDLSKK